MARGLALTSLPLLPGVNRHTHRQPGEVLDAKAVPVQRHAQRVDVIGAGASALLFLAVFPHGAQLGIVGEKLVEALDQVARQVAVGIQLPDLLVVDLVAVFRPVRRLRP